MEIEKLIATMAEEINSDNYKLQIVFDRNIQVINNFKKKGFLSKRMNALLNEKINNDISDNHFQNLVFRANKKIVKLEQSVLNPVSNDKEQNEVTSADIVNLDDDGLLEPLETWRYKTNIEITLRQAIRLEKNGINIEKFNTLGLNNPQQISKHLTTIEHRKNKD